MQLSKLENTAYEKIKKSGLIVFSADNLGILLGYDKTKIYNIIKALKKKDVIKYFGKRKFSLLETDEFMVASELNFPSYISFWSALNYYGFSDNTPKKIFIATTKYCKDIVNFKYVTLSKKKFFGYTSIGKIIIAEKEKTIIDSLLLPRYSGGVKEIKKSIENSMGKINIEKIVNYALKIESNVVVRRLGYLLDCFGISNQKLEKNVGKGFEILDPTLSRKNNLNKKWHLDINI